MADKLMTPEFRVSFPNLFKARKANENAEPKFSVAMLFKKGENLKALRRMANEAAKEKWGNKVPKNIRMPFLDQGDHDYEGYEPGAVLIRASSKFQPGVVDAKVQQIIDESEIYPGCYARATVRAYAYDVAGNRGVAFGLQNLQKLRDGESLGGRTRAEDDFSPVEDDDDLNDENADSLLS
ncbi:DUF2815 family protein [Magnetococcales bacterium HHB-1]